MVLFRKVFAARNLQKPRMGDLLAKQKRALDIHRLVMGLYKNLDRACSDKAR